jgi:hypothetical protein
MGRMVTDQPGVKIAYLVLAHRYFDQLFRLVDRLNAGNVVFYIHIDKKVSQKDYTFVTEHFQSFENVHFTKRFTCYWAGFGIMRATLQGIKEIVESKSDADYIVLLSGQDYPIKTNSYIHNFFSEKKGISFVSHMRFPHPEWGSCRGGWDRVQLWHFITKYNHRTYPSRNFFGYGRLRFLNGLWNKVYPSLPSFRRTFPNGMHPYGGAQFWCLSKKHYLAVHQFVEANPNYVNFFRYVFVSDELLVQTIVGNSFPPDEVHNDTLHFLEWYRDGAILNSSDMPTISSTHYLFARKFDATVDGAVLDIIDREILELQDADCVM